MSMNKVLELARADLGYTENPPGSNRTKYWEAYDPKMQGQPWCVAAPWYWFNEAGERMAFFGGGRTASCSMLLRWYREQGLTVPVKDVQTGDIVLLNFHGGKDPEHCGLVVESEDITSKDGTYDSYKRIMTIEGNTTPGEEGSQDNGGCVALKRRYPNQIVAVCRPQYQLEPVTVDDVTGHWAKASIEWAKEKGLIKGYPDGSFKPNNPLTRAEACAMFERFYQLLWEDDMR